MLSTVGPLGHAAFKKPSLLFPEWLLVLVDIIVSYFEYNLSYQVHQTFVEQDIFDCKHLQCSFTKQTQFLFLFLKIRLRYLKRRFQLSMIVTVKEHIQEAVLVVVHLATPYQIFKFLWNMNKVF